MQLRMIGEAGALAWHLGTGDRVGAAVLSAMYTIATLNIICRTVMDNGSKHRRESLKQHQGWIKDLLKILK